MTGKKWLYDAWTCLSSCESSKIHLSFKGWWRDVWMPNNLKLENLLCLLSYKRNVELCRLTLTTSMIRILLLATLILLPSAGLVTFSVITIKSFQLQPVDTCGRQNSEMTTKISVLRNIFPSLQIWGKLWIWWMSLSWLCYFIWLKGFCRWN